MYERDELWETYTMIRGTAFWPSNAWHHLLSIGMTGNLLLVHRTTQAAGEKNVNISLHFRIATIARAIFLEIFQKIIWTQTRAPKLAWLKRFHKHVFKRRTLFVIIILPSQPTM